MPGIFPDCGGGDQEHTFQSHQVPFDFYSAGVSCGQCSIHIPDPWFSKVNKTNSIESNVLDKRNQANSQFSRLACCVQVRPDLNEMIVVVGNNRSDEGDWFGGND